MRSLVNAQPYDLEISGANGGDSGVVTHTFCDPMNVNSTGLSTQLTAIVGSGIHSGVRFEAMQGPPGQFASLIVGSEASEPGIPLGQGRFCLSTDPGEAFGRYNVSGSELNSIGRFDANGVYQNLVGTSQAGAGFDVPTDLPNFAIPILAGQSWHFQMWTRDIGGQSNWSNRVSVLFQTLP